jgi:hypothetical protein
MSTPPFPGGACGSGCADRPPGFLAGVAGSSGRPAVPRSAWGVGGMAKVSLPSLIPRAPPILSLSSLWQDRKEGLYYNKRAGETDCDRGGGSSLLPQGPPVLTG